MQGRYMLSYWLYAVAAMRMLSVAIGICKPDVFKTKVYRLRPDYVNSLFGRTFASWTFVTCMLCVSCGARMDSEPALYLATLGSFVVALTTFAAEIFVFRTVDFKGGASPLVVSSISIVWMAAGWGTYTGYTL
jgi:Erg28 like protein